MRGIVSAAAYIPRARLDRSTIAGFVGTGGGRGTRSVASYDEDTTTMGVEAARIALRSAPADVRPDALWFSTVAPAYLDKTNATAEFVERWRTPGEHRSKQWEERFGETKYLPLGDQAWREALKAAGIEAGDVHTLIVAGLHARAVRSLKGRLGVAKEIQADDLTATLGNSGAAQPLVLLTRALETAEPNKVIALLVLADGADVLLFRTTDAVGSWQPARSVDAQVAAGKEIPYGKFLAWRGILPVEPPRRPEP